MLVLRCLPWARKLFEPIFVAPCTGRLLGCGQNFKRPVEIGFWRFLRYGAVITAVDLVVVFGVLYAERWLGVLGWLGL